MSQNIPTNEASIEDPLIGQTLGGRYLVLEKLGAGGISTVYKARHTATDQNVALKTIYFKSSSDQKNLGRFQQEAKILASLQHPNIITVKAIDVDASRGFIAMECLEGTDLAHRIKSKEPFTLEELKDIFGQTALGLAYAHSHGIIHRDIKPSNIMLVPQPDGSELVKILDFGISKLVDGSQQITTQTGVIVGSPIYMSPEQFNGKNVDARTDIYSLGCMMYECVTGQPPFTGDSTMEIAGAHLYQSPAPVNNAKYRALEPLILKAMEKDPNDRYQTMDQLLDALNNGETASPAKKQLAVRPETLPKIPTLIWSTAICLIALGSVAFMVINSKHTAPETIKLADPPAGIVFRTFAKAVDHGEPVSEDLLAKVDRAIKQALKSARRDLHDKDSSMLEFAARALERRAQLEDRNGEYAKRDEDMRKVLEIRHGWYERCTYLSLDWAKFQEKQGDLESAIKTLEDEIAYQKKKDAIEGFVPAKEEMLIKRLHELQRKLDKKNKESAN